MSIDDFAEDFAAVEHNVLPTAITRGASLRPRHAERGADDVQDGDLNGAAVRATLTTGAHRAALEMDDPAASVEHVAAVEAELNALLGPFYFGGAERTAASVEGGHHLDRYAEVRSFHDFMKR